MRSKNQAMFGSGRQRRALGARPSRVEAMSLSVWVEESESPWLRLLAHRARLRESRERMGLEAGPPPVEVRETGSGGQTHYT